MSGVFWGVLAYIGVQLAIGAWVSRRIRTETDYILAGRQIGFGLATFSIFATWFGAESILGAGGSAYNEGLAGVQGDPFAYAVGIVLVGLVFAVPLWRRGITTFADFFRERYSPGVERLTVLLLIPGSVMWAAAQIRGFGQVMSTTSGFDVTTGMVLGAFAILIYAVLGGLLADIYTDLIQGLAIIVGLVVILVAVLLETDAAAALKNVPAERLVMLGKDQPLLDFLEQWAIPICGSVVAIELVSRILACRSAEVARAGALAGGMLYLAVAAIPVFLGLVGPQLVPGLSEGEQIIPRLAETYLPTILYVMFAGALVSAILSTVDSALLAAAALVSHNVALRAWSDFPERAKVAVTRAIVAGLVIIAFVIALRSTGISDLVELASAFASAGVFVTLVFGLCTHIGGPKSAYAALIAGGGAWALGHALGGPVPYLCGLGAATIAYVAMALVAPNRL